MASDKHIQECLIPDRQPSRAKRTGLLNDDGARCHYRFPFPSASSDIHSAAVCIFPGICLFAVLFRKNGERTPWGCASEQVDSLKRGSVKELLDKRQYGPRMLPCWLAASMMVMRTLHHA